MFNRSPLPPGKVLGKDKISTVHESTEHTVPLANVWVINRFWCELVYRYTVYSLQLSEFSSRIRLYFTITIYIALFYNYPVFNGDTCGEGHP
jgi:hypothetical protein